MNHGQGSRASKATSKSSTRSSKRSQLAEQKLAQLRRRQELERQQQELQRQQEEVRRKVQLQIAQDEVDNAILEENDSSSSISGNSQNVSDHGLPVELEVTSAEQRVEEYVRTLDAPSVKQSKLNPEAVLFNAYSNLDLYTGFKNLIDSVHESLNLSKPELLSLL